MRFLADMGVSLTTVAALRAAGHDAVHLRDEGPIRLPDPDIVAKALAESRIADLAPAGSRAILPLPSVSAAICTMEQSPTILALKPLPNTCWPRARVWHGDGHVPRRTMTPVVLVNG